MTRRPARHDGGEPRVHVRDRRLRWRGSTQIQGAAHLSPRSLGAGRGRRGIVTASASNGFCMQDPTPDADDATSEAIFVFTLGAPTRERRRRGPRQRDRDRVPARRRRRTANLTITELTRPDDHRAVDRQPAAGADRDRRRRPGPADDGDRGRRDRQRRDERRLRPGQRRHRLLREPRGHARPGRTTPVVVGPTQRLRRDLRARRRRRRRRRAHGPRRDRHPRRPTSTPSGSSSTTRWSSPRRASNVGDGFTAPVVGVIDYNFGNFKLAGHRGAHGVSTAGSTREVDARPGAPTSSPSPRSTSRTSTRPTPQRSSTRSPT